MTTAIVVARRLAAVVGLAVFSAGCPGRDSAPQPNAPPRAFGTSADPGNLTSPNAHQAGVAPELGARAQRS